MRMLSPSQAKNVIKYEEPEPLFARYQIERQLNAMFSPYVTLRSGGYLVINQTEALVSVDVNSGKATREFSIEETALNTNLEASDEIARQLKLRDLAGLIVIDFIDMEERRNNRKVENRLKDALRHDRARIQVGRISHFGLMEMSRQRLRTGVLEGSTTQCPHCQGTGIIRSVESVALAVLRALEDHLLRDARSSLTAVTTADVALYILNNKRAFVTDMETPVRRHHHGAGERPHAGRQLRHRAIGHPGRAAEDCRALGRQHGMGLRGPGGARRQPTRSAGGTGARTARRALAARDAAAGAASATTGPSDRPAHRDEHRGTPTGPSAPPTARRDVRTRTTSDADQPAPHDDHARGGGRHSGRARRAASTWHAREDDNARNSAADAGGADVAAADAVATATAPARAWRRGCSTTATATSAAGPHSTASEPLRASGATEPRRIRRRCGPAREQTWQAPGSGAQSGSPNRKTGERAARSDRARGAASSSPRRKIRRARPARAGGSASCRAD